MAARISRAFRHIGHDVHRRKATAAPDGAFAGKLLEGCQISFVRFSKRWRWWPWRYAAVGSNDFVCVNLPLFKRAYDTNNGPIITVDDLETISGAYRTMLGKLRQIVPNVQVERSALGGFSNGAHAVALLLAGGDEFILGHFRAFYLVEGGSALAANALGRPALKSCRFLIMRGDQKETDPE